ncbi:activating signal cointegrator 1 complex subunit 3 [Purpureocillium lavendulum]|uniref:Activating signal cointegrator 1 complex subunit 3 n=1 Tax=Purpureocillium lavendulum TaxID=1247861 RepID=A0AB34G0Q5_9HYPO|nr:activating signal cointegrator 1 complex subunit 3 [Purpureocillium lavendulum]
MSWWSSNKLHNTDPSLVSGHDDVCSCKRVSVSSLDFDSDEEFLGGLQETEELENNTQPSASNQQVSDSPNGRRQMMPDSLLQMKMKGQCNRYNTPAFRQIPDYCPVRHRNAIIRLLFIIEGRDVLIDSANRVWTLVGLAKMFDCVSAIRDLVLQWFMYGNNMRFVEVLPEEALRIGFALENMQITQNAFRILVNEMALQEAASDGCGPKSSRTTIFGRRTGDCTDELSNLIQHAARSLVDRVSLLKTQLHSPDLFDFWNIEEWGKLRRLELLLAKEESLSCAIALIKLRLLMKVLPAAVTEIVQRVLVDSVPQNLNTFCNMDLDRATYLLPQDFEKLEQIFARLNDTQKLLCPFFYSELGEQCSWHLYLGAHAKRSRVPFLTLVKELDAALERVASEQPAMMGSPDCAEFVRAYDTSSKTLVYHFNSPVIDLDRLDWQVKDALQPITVSWIRHDVDPPLNLTRHMLLTLSMHEMKFLPLWAGGFDDGTGGVFESYVPPTDMGPNGPGPAYHTGNTLPSAPASISESMVEEMSAMKFRGSTTAASVDVHDSISTVYRPDRVIADDVTIASESFTMAGSEYQEAQFAVPAAHQGAGQAVDMMVDSDADTDTHDASTTDNGSVARERRDDTVGPYSEDSDSDDSLVVI